MRILKQSTATTVLLGPFVDSTDGFTAETGLTISQADVQLWKEGGTTLAQKNDATTCTARTIGYYTCPLNTTDTNTLGILTIAVNESGALPIRTDFYVVPANVYDSFILGTDTLDVQVTGMGAGVITAAAIATDAIDADAMADGALTAGTFANDCLTAAKFAGDVATEFQSGMATAAALDAVDNFLDTEIAAIKVNTDKFTTAMELDGAEYRFTTNALEQAPTGGGGGGNPLVLRDATAQGGGASIITLDAGASATNDLYKYNIIGLNGGTGEGQSRQIIGYDGATKQATISPDWIVIPDATSDFVIGALGVDAATLQNIEDEIWDALRVDHAVSGSFGEYVNANVTLVSDDAAAAANMEAFFDGTGYALSNVTLPWNPVWDAEVQSEVNDALEAIHLDHLLAVDYDPSSKPGTSTALLNEIVENDSGVSRFTANALEMAPVGGGGGGPGGDGSTLTQIPWNAAWDAEVQSEVADALAAYVVPSTTYLDGRSLPAADYGTAAGQTAIVAAAANLSSRIPATLDNGLIRSKVEQVIDVVLGQGGTGGQSIGGS